MILISVLYQNASTSRISSVHLRFQVWSQKTSSMILTTWIQISRKKWNGFFSNISHQIMISLTSIVSRSKTKPYKRQKKWNRYSNVSSIIMSKSDDLRLFYKMIVFEPWNFFGGPFLHNFCGGWAVFDLDTSLPEN